MKLEPLGKNQTRVIVQIPDEELDLTWDKDIYFSYGQPVLVVNYRNATIHESCERYSKTTSKHLNAFKRMCNRYDDRGGPIDPAELHGREWTIIQANEHRMHTVAGER
tara:strand:- start:550 stop:873 length:324 start_codon:yes stop_codon:yes gene_type:complete